MFILKCQSTITPPTHIHSPNGKNTNEFLTSYIFTIHKVRHSSLLNVSHIKVFHHYILPADDVPKPKQCWPFSHVDVSKPESDHSKRYLKSLS